MSDDAGRICPLCGAALAEVALASFTPDLVTSPPSEAERPLFLEATMPKYWKDKITI